MYLYVVKIYWVSSVSETEGFYRKSCIGVNELISLHHFVNRIVPHIFSFWIFLQQISDGQGSPAVDDQVYHVIYVSSCSPMQSSKTC